MSEPIQKTDKRYNGGRPHAAFEAEALGQSYLTKVVVDFLDSWLPEPLKAVHVRERAEREDMRKYLIRYRMNGRRKRK